MEITAQVKERVVSALLEDMRQRGCKSQNEYAQYIQRLLNISFDKSAMSQIKKPEGRNAIKETSWLKLATHFNVFGEKRWRTAQTGTFVTVTTALNLCKNHGVWQVLCDNAGIGKTYAATKFAEAHKENAIYVDCSQCTSKTEFITEVGRQLGLERTTTYNQLWREAVDQMLLMQNPVLILDEFGDVADSVITLLKGTYNKADRGDFMAMGCYMIGADNLRKRLIDGRKNKRQSYAEFWSRIDNNITNLGFSTKQDVYRQELREEVEQIVALNLPDRLDDKRHEIIDKVMKTNGTRAIRKELAKYTEIKNLNAV